MSCDQTLKHNIRFSGAVSSVALVVLVTVVGLFPSGLAVAEPARPLTTSNPTCSSLDTSMACVQAWANGITIDYTGVLGPAPPQPSQSVALNLVGGSTTIDRAFNCVSGTYSVFVPLTAGEWEGSSTLRTSSDPGSPDNTFHFDLVVGSPGSPLAPPTTCELSNEAGPSGTFVPPVAAIVVSPDGFGFWLADSDGTVLGTGDAVSYWGRAHCAAECPHRWDGRDGRGQWLLARRWGRRGIQLRKRPFLRFRRGTTAESAGRRHGKNPRQQGLLAGCSRWWHLRLRGCIVLWLDGRKPPQQADCWYGRYA